MSKLDNLVDRILDLLGFPDNRNAPIPEYPAVIMEYRWSLQTENNTHRYVTYRHGDNYLKYVDNGNPHTGTRRISITNFQEHNPVYAQAAPFQIAANIATLILQGDYANINFED